VNDETKRNCKKTVTDYLKVLTCSQKLKKIMKNFSIRKALFCGRDSHIYLLKHVICITPQITLSGLNYGILDYDIL
jgi:hypothetical protein